MLGAVNVQIPTHIALFLKQCSNSEIGGRPLLTECTILQIPVCPVYHANMYHDSDCKHDAVKYTAQLLLLNEFVLFE